MLQIVLGMGFVEWGLNKGKMTSLDMFSDGREPGNFGFDPMGLMKPVSCYVVASFLQSTGLKLE
jgi:hypothetical protein